MKIIYKVVCKIPAGIMEDEPVFVFETESMSIAPYWEGEENVVKCFDTGGIFSFSLSGIASFYQKNRIMVCVRHVSGSEELREGFRLIFEC